jgi:hypothetical protein
MATVRVAEVLFCYREVYIYTHKDAVCCETLQSAQKVVSYLIARIKGT